jgi:regulatory protein YycI of two-component signal transduction system YycFG
MKLQLKLLIVVFLVIGIFLVFQNFSYSQVSQAQQEAEEGGEEEKKVELSSHKVEKSDNSTGRFSGQVQNMINKNVEYVTIIATFYDKDGKIIGSKSTYTKPNTIKPNMTAPFEMILGDDISSTNNITSYDVTITWRFPGESERYSNVYG